MSDVLKMQLDIQNNLEKDIDKSSKAMKGFNSLIESSKEKFGKVADSINKNVLGALRSVRNTLAQIVPLVGTVFSGAIIMDSVRNVLFMDKAITQLSFRMGHGAEGTHALKNAVYDLNAELGIGIENAETLVSELVNLRIPLDMINQMAKSVGMLSEITGVSADQAADLGGNLVRVGRLGQESVDGIFASMIGVQRAVGLTRDEMNSLSRTISNSTQMLNQMGKSAGEIEKYNRGIIKLAAAFASVGVEAEKILNIMDELLDPGEVEKHAFLLSKLGVSLGDAFEGNIDPQQLISGFRDLGTTLQGMTGPAAAAMAQQLGMSVRDLRQMGNLGDKEMAKVAEAMADGASASEAMSEAFKEQETPLQRFERTMERIKGEIGKIAELILPTVEKAVAAIKEIDFEKVFGKVKDFIESFPGGMKTAAVVIIGGILLLTTFIKRRFFSMSADISSNLTRGVSEGIRQGAEKGSLAMRKEFADTKQMDFEVRLKKAPKFQKLTKDAELWQARAETSLIGPAKFLAEKAAKWNNYLAKSTRPMSKLAERNEAARKAQADRVMLMENERSQILGAIDTRTTEIEVQQKQYEKRLNQLAEIEKTQEHGLTARQQRELKVINRLYDANKTAIQNLANERDERDTLYDNIREAAVKKLSDDQLNAIHEEAEARLETLRINERNNEIALETINQEADILQNSLNALNEKGELTAQEALDRRELIKALEEEEAKRRELESLISSSAAETKSIEDSMRTVNQEIDKRTESGIFGPGEIAETRGFFQELRDRAVGMGNALGFGVKEGGMVLENSSMTAGQAIRGAFSAKTIGTALQRGTKAGLKGLGNAVVGIFRRGGRQARNEVEQSNVGGGGGMMAGFLKILGPIAFLIAFLKRLEPVQEALRKVMDSLKEPIENLLMGLMPVVDTFIDMIGPVMEKLVEALMPLVEAVAQILSPIISALIKIIGPLLVVVGQLFSAGLKPLMGLILFLVEFLLPPLLVAMGGLMFVMGLLLEGVGLLTRELFKMPSRLGHLIRVALSVIPGISHPGQYTPPENALMDAAEGILNAGRDLRQSGFQMMADVFSPPEVKDSVEEGAAQGVSRGIAASEMQPTQIEAVDGSVRIRESVHTPAAQEDSQESYEHQTAEASQQTAQASQQARDFQEQQVGLLRAELVRSEERHDQIISSMQRLISALESSTPTAARARFR